MVDGQRTTAIQNLKAQAYEPYSLLGLSVEAAATCYRFNPRDLFFYHREIDFSHLHAGALTTLDYGLSLNNRLPRWLMRRLPQKISTVMMNRRSNIHKLYTELAARIVNFDSVQEIDELERVLGFGVSELSKLRQKYVEYAQQMVEIEKLGIMVNKGDQLQKLLMCIQRERLWLKQNSRNLDQVFFAAGDGPNVITDKPTEAYESRLERNVYKMTAGRTYGKSIMATTDKTRTEAVLQDMNNNRTQGKVNISKYGQSADDDDGDEGIVLYGLICA